MNGNNKEWGPRFESDGSVLFSLWAPNQPAVSLELGERCHRMDKDADGWFSVSVPDVSSGARYRYRLADGLRVPDPASRFQPGGVEGPSQIWSPGGFRWEATGWKGLPWEEAIIYEIHVGAFTAAGTFEAAIAHLPRLAAIGITAIEIMPLAQFPGERGWGYDGVFQYAPHHSYGTPDDLRRFIDTAHQCGLMVFLDVVYNHFGPQGNFLPLYAPQFFRNDEPTPWGPRIAFEKDPVRRYFIGNVLYWLEDFQLDGLRLDAIDEISDDSDVHILREISDVVHARFPDRHVHLITENPANGADLLADIGNGRRLFVADWNDDFHHALHVAVTGEASGHYEPFKDAPWRQVKRALAEGYLHPGKQTLTEHLPPSPSLPPTAFVHFLQNHDQVGNRALGERLHTMLERNVHRLLTEILLLSPQIPLLFMGDDHLSTSPFRFFADYDGDLAKDIYRNRFKEAANFGGLPKGASAQDVADPNECTTFQDSKIDWASADNGEQKEWQGFLQTLIAARHRYVVPHLRQAAGYAGSIRSERETDIFLDWTLSDGILRLRANASSQPCELEKELGTLVYSSPSNADRGTIMPWSAALFWEAAVGPTDRSRENRNLSRNRLFANVQDRS